MLSSVQSRRVFTGEKRNPSGSRTAWSAMSLAAPRYLLSSVGEMSERASAALVNPSPAAPSAGNSRVGRRSTPVRSRIVPSYSVLLSRRSGTCPGSPARAWASASRKPRTQATSRFRSSAVGCGFFFGGISPASSISISCCHGLRSFRTRSSEANRSRSRLPFLTFVEWQFRQYFVISGRTMVSYSIFGFAGSFRALPSPPTTSASKPNPAKMRTNLTGQNDWWFKLPIEAPYGMPARRSVVETVLAAISR